MKTIRTILTLFFSIVCLYQPYCHARIVGNRSAVFIIPNAPLFPASDTDNIMLGFGHFQGGFILEDASTSCIFDSIFPVSGTVDMRGGTLYLLEDLVLTETVQLAGLGTIVGNNHTIEFCESVSSLPSNFTSIKDTNLFFRGNVSLNSTLEIQGTCLISSANNRTMSLKNGQLLVASGTELTLENINFSDVEHDGISSADSSVSIVVDNVQCFLTGDFVFDNGTITIKNNSALLGSGTFTCTNDAHCLIASNSTLLLDRGLELIFGRQTPGGTEPINFQDSTSKLECGLCTLHITNSGAQFIKGTVAFTGNVNLISDSINTLYGLTFGNNTAADDLTIYLGPGCLLTYVSGMFTYNNFSPNAYATSSLSSTFYFKNAAYFYIATTLNLIQNNVIQETRAHITIAPGASLYYNNTTIYIPGYGTVRLFTHMSTIYPSCAILTAGDSITLENGSLVLGTVVTTTNAQITGVGTVESPIIFLPNTALNVGIQGQINNKITLNGSRLNLKSDLTFNYRDFTAPGGTVDLGSYTLTRKYPINSTFSTSMTFTGNLGVISLTQDATLTGTWTIYGNVTINGNGNTLTMTGGCIYAASGAQITLKNIKVSNAHANSFKAAADNSTFILDNVSIIFTDNFTMTHGSFTAKNNVSFSGPYTFTYASPMSSRIDLNSTLLLNGSMEFYVGRATPGGAEPIILTSDSSTLEYRQCTLHVNANGMQLTQGKINFNGSVILEMDSTDTPYGLVFGDNITAANDLDIVFGAGCLATMQSGSVVYNNVNSNGFANSAISSVVTLYPALTFALNTNCTLPGNTFSIVTTGTALPTIQLAPGTKLNLNSTTFTIPGVGSSVYKGYFDYPYGNTFFFMNTEDSIYLNSGDLLIPTQIIGASNQISGNGSISNPIIYTNPTAATTLRLQGSVDSFLYLTGGTLSLLADASLTVGDCFQTTGTISLDGKTLTLQPPTASAYTVPILWNGASGTVRCTQDITLTTTWTFAGSVVLDANGNTINFEGGSIAVAPGSSLTIRNANLNNIGNNSIYCTDDTGAITLYNVTWSQEENFTLEHGSLNYRGTTFMTGPNLQFTYASTATSTFYSNSTLTLDNLFTFSYAPSNNSTTLLKFTDFSSRFLLNHSVLYIVPGLQVTNGQLMLQQAPTIYALGDGLILGDMTISDSSADMQITFLDSTYPNIQAGTFNYQNGLESSWQMWTQANIQFSDGVKVYLYRNINLNNGAALFTTNNILYRYQSACPIASAFIGTVSNPPAEIDLCTTPT